METLPPPRKGRPRLADVAIIAILCMAFYFSLSFTRPLASPDEGRYSEIPREMAETGDWVTPRLNGVQYFYKPPLFYWMQATSIEALGVNRMSLRLPNSAMAVLGIVLTYLAAAWTYGRKAGLFSAAVLATTLFYYAMGNIITLDMTVSVFITGALFSFMLAWRERESAAKRGAFWISAFAFSALAVMTKGLIGILIPGCVAFLYLMLTGPVSSLRSVRKSDLAWWAAGLAVFAAIAVPWHVLAAAANPPLEGAEGMFSKNPEGQGFAWYYFINEHFLRYLDAETSHRYQPFWFFFAFAPVGFIPWIVLLPRAVRNAAAGGWAKLKASNPEFIFLCVWIAFVLLFFSISKSKLLPYILPIYPALAVIVGRLLAKVWDAPEKYRLRPEAYTLVGLGFAAAVAVVPLFAHFSAKGKILNPESAMICFGALGIFLLCGSLVTLYFILKRRPHAATFSLFAAIALFLFCFNPLGSHLQRPDTEEFAKIIMQKASPDAKIIASECYNEAQDLPVWLGRVISVYKGPTEEQAFGFNREREKHGSRYLDDAEFSEAMSKSECFIVFHRESYKRVAGRLPGSERLKKLADHGKLSLYHTEKPE